MNNIAAATPMTEDEIAEIEEALTEPNDGYSGWWDDQEVASMVATIRALQAEEKIDAKCLENALNKVRDQAEALRAAREALVQGRGALRIDAMVDEVGEPYGTTTVALDYITAALAQIDALAGGEVGNG